MNARHSRLARLVTLTVVSSMPLLGMAGVASAKTHHHHGGRGGSIGGGKGGPPPLITVTVDPNGPNNPLVEVGQSEVYAVVQVETSPSFAGDAVVISSQQLHASCQFAAFFSFAPNASGAGESITVPLDNEGNATAIMEGDDCAPGQDLVEADLSVAPFYTATTVVTVNPPIVTPPGVVGEPQTSGVAEEVETGDTPASGDSLVYAVFFVEENPVYAEQAVEISSPQLQDRCLGGWEWNPSNATLPPNTGTPGPTFSGAVDSPSTARPKTILDDDGNAAFFFVGISCAAGPSTVVADVLAGTHDTFTTTFTVLPPAPTI